MLFQTHSQSPMYKLYKSTKHRSRSKSYSRFIMCCVLISTISHSMQFNSRWVFFRESQWRNILQQILECSLHILVPKNLIQQNHYKLCLGLFKIPLVFSLFRKSLPKMPDMSFPVCLFLISTAVVFITKQKLKFLENCLEVKC